MLFSPPVAQAPSDLYYQEQSTDVDTKDIAEQPVLDDLQDKPVGAFNLYSIDIKIIFL